MVYGNATFLNTRNYLILYWSQMMKFTVITLWCQMNYADTARVKSVLKNCWFTPVETVEEADIVIFDTCSVRQKSEDKVTGKLKEIPLDKKVWITGCMIQHNMRNQKIMTGKKLPENLKTGNFWGVVLTKEPRIVGLTSEEVKNLKKSDKGELVGINHSFNPLFHNLSQKWKNIELFFRIDDTGFLPLMLQKLGYEVRYDRELTNEYSTIVPEGINSSMNAHNKTAYIPISTGCNQFCAYCIVPFARGLERWFPVEQIVKEAKIHLANGVKEIVLLGQIVNKHPDFLTIVKEVLKLEGLEWLRYTSPYPTYYSDELLTLHETEPKLCPHIHIPFQSGSNAVLKKMFRGYSAEQCYAFIDKIRSLKRPISITTDIILWFPWETEEDFQETLKLTEYARFDMIYMWIYSNRPGTFADRKYPDEIPYKVKHQRRSQLNDLLYRISDENNQLEVWAERTMIVNEITENWDIFGYTDNMKQIILKSSPKTANLEIWMLLPVRITKWMVFKLEGEPLL